MKAISQFLIIAFLFIIVASVNSHAQDTAATQPTSTVILTEEVGKYPLGLYLEILEDPTTRLTVEQVVSPELDRRFVPSQVAVPIFGHTASAYWVRFRVRNEEVRQRNGVWRWLTRCYNM